MRLNKILSKCSISYSINSSNKINNFNVKGISSHSKEIKDNFIFCAIKGAKYDGEDFIPELYKLRNIVLIISKKSNFKEKFKFNELNSFLIILVEDVALFSSEIANILYKNDIKELVAVTGTNGKTSVAHYTRQIWSDKLRPSASIGTLGIIFKKKKINTFGLTTPTGIDLHKILNKLSRNGCENLILEVSSIGIDQNRIFPLKFDKIAFTNLTRDHLDYHKNMRNYKKVKGKLFENFSHKKTLAILNSDDKNFKYFKDICFKRKIKILDFGFSSKFLIISKILKK